MGIALQRLNRRLEDQLCAEVHAVRRGAIHLLPQRIAENSNRHCILLDRKRFFIGRLVPAVFPRLSGRTRR